MTAPSESLLARALGVTRVARVTGLDRAGVEVACAVRPGGHVLQVCNGKGLTWEDARRGALYETAELWAAEHVPQDALVWGSARALAEAGHTVWRPEALEGAGPWAAPDLAGLDVRLAWREARELHSDTPVLVPAHVVHCPPQCAPALGPAARSWTSSGSGAHPDLARATLHALLEAVERDQLARALPHGYTPTVVRQRLFDPASLAAAAPRTHALAESLRARGFDVHLLDAVPPKRAVGLPVAAALLVDREEGPVPLTAGYACALDRDEALLKSLLEAVQSRLTDIHGAREDVAAADRAEARAGAQALSALCARVRTPRDVRTLPHAPARDGVSQVLRRLKRAGFSHAAALELPAPVAGLHVVRVLVPGLRLSELL